jgi:hypothetical protein
MTMGHLVIQQVDGKLVVAGYSTTAIMMLHWCATTPMVLWIPALMGMARSPRDMGGNNDWAFSVIQQDRRQTGGGGV